MLIAEKFRRLREMGAEELSFRIRQKARIQREKWQLALNGKRSNRGPWWQAWDPEHISNADLRRRIEAGDASAAELLPDHFANRAVPCFFWGAAERARIVEAVKKNFAEQSRRLIASAEDACAHRFKIFAYPSVECGKQIPWHRDLVHGVDSDLKHYSQQPTLDMDKVGDSKITWEINRHQHFMTLSQAYLLTSDERFAEECLSQWEDWIAKNPHLRGMNWSSSLEVAFRCWSWTWTLFLLLGSRSLTGERIGTMTQALAQSAAFVAENLSIYYAPNTHLMGEAFALYVVGILFPELKGSDGWGRLGRRVLEEEMQKQIRDDGSHFEQSIFYHRYAVEFLLSASILADRNNNSFPRAYRERLEKMLEFLEFTEWPSGSHPSIGDSDGGRLLAFGAFDAEDQRPVLSTGAVYFQRGDFRKSAGSFHEQTIWLLGSGAADIFETIPRSDPPQTSRMFADSGIASLRSDWSDRAKFLLFDAGPQGMKAAGHGHADSLSIVCAANGVNWLVDPGTYVYSSSREWRDYFRSTPAHNTIAIDGEDQAERVDWFKWRKLPEVKLESFFSHPEFDFVAGSHNGYSRFGDSLIHRRSVTFVKPEYWVIADELSGSGKHEIQAFFHFGPGVEVERTQQGWLAMRGSDRLLLIPANASLDFRLVKGEEPPIQGWYSADYGHREPAYALIGEAKAQLPAEFDWLILPLAAGDELPAVNFADDSRSFSFAMGNWQDTIIRRGAQQSAPFSTDAAIAMMRKDLQGSARRLILVGGSSLLQHGNSILASDGRFDHFVAEWTENRLEIEARPERNFRLELPRLLEVRINGKPYGKMETGAVVFRGNS
jgi:Heparinase II/III-like protein/Heparinase II/III N-terminus